MRMTLLFLFVLVFQLQAELSYSQNTKISLDIRNSSIEKILQTIEEKSEFFFLYNSKLINVDRKTDIRVKDESIASILNRLFEKENVEYEVKGTQIVLHPKEMNKITSTLVANVQQKRQITGKITDELGEPVIGANVVEKGTTNGTVTDIDGNFTLGVGDGAALQISYIGYLEQEILTTGRTFVNAILREDTKALDEVVVVGYGVQKKTNLTGAVSQVRMADVLGDRPVIDTKTALQGSIPGLVITGGTSPGGSKDINIRGVNSINGGEPLVLIDNVPGTLDLINPEDIESISVLKDASAAAIYGARGAFGVVLVNTKRAKKNTKLSINYNTNIAFQKSINNTKSATVEQTLETFSNYYEDGKYYAQSQDLSQWLGYVREYNADPSGFVNKYPGSYFKNGVFQPTGDENFYYLKATFPHNSIMDNYGFQQTHNLSATGGDDRITYRMSFGYTDQNGPLLTDKDSYDRLNMTSYVNGDITDWLSQSIDVNHSKANRSYIANGSVYNTTLPIFIPEEMPHYQDVNGEVYLVNAPKNFLLLSEPAKTITEATRLFLRTSVRPFEGFESIFEYTYDKKQYDYKRYTNDARMIMMEQSFAKLSSTPTYSNIKQMTAIDALNVYATYEKSFLDTQNFKLMAGYNQESRDYEALTVTKQSLINPEMPSFSGSTGITTAADEYKQYSIRSGFFRFNYNYKEKYLLEINGRYDGSSKFPKETRFGFFPSFSAGWQISKEPFMNWSENWLNELKPRVSWGQLGNQSGVDEYGYLPVMDTEYASWILNGETPLTLIAPDLVRSNYTWEVVETLGAGLDFAMLKHRLTGSLEWYNRKTKDMLAPGLELPSVVGANAPMQNVADLETNGWEMSVKWRDNIGDWRYSVGFNIFDATTKIIKYKNEVGLFYARNDAQDAKRYRVGMELGEIWGYVTDGYYTADDFTDFSNWTLKEGIVKLNGYTPRPGDVKFKDMNDDGIISVGEDTVEKPGDRKIIGNSTARYQYGGNLSVGWKNFDLSVMFQGVGKRDYWLSGDVMFGPSSHWGNVFYNQLDYWKPVDAANGDYTAVNPNANYPRIYDRNNNSGSNYRIQTKYLSNAAYLRLKNVTLSYKLPQSLLTQVGFSTGRIFFSGENMFTNSHLPKGVDPERISWGYPFYATYSFGISVTL